MQSSKNPNGPMVVKIQASLASNAGYQSMLVYDESRDFFVEREILPEIKKLLRGRPKAYFEIELKDTIMHINKEVSNPGW